MPQRFAYIVTCTLVMKCTDIDRCRQVERAMTERGFEPRPAVLSGHSCKRTLVREHEFGTGNELRDAVCEEVESIVSSQVEEWSAFVQVCGGESAWATLTAGRPTLRG